MQLRYIFFSLLLFVAYSYVFFTLSDESPSENSSECNATLYLDVNESHNENLNLHVSGPCKEIAHMLYALRNSTTFKQWEGNGYSMRSKQTHRLPEVRHLKIFQKKY